MRIVVTDGHALNPGDLSWSGIEALGELAVHERTPADAIVQRSRGASAVLTNKVPFRAETLAALPDLRYIGVLATGYDIVDVKAARERGIVVSNIPTYGTASVAQFTFALLLELCHQVGRHAEDVRAGNWTRNPDWSYALTPLVELAGKTLGVVGFGRIGRQVAEIGRAMGMRAIAHDPIAQAKNGEAGVEWRDLDALLAEADVVTLHCPLTADNRGMIHAAALRRMKPSAFLINTARGPLVVDAELAAALNEGVIAAAALDVLSTEPPPADNPLLSARNCIVTPHIAWSTREARARLMAIAADNLRAFAEGRAQNVVS